MMRGDLVTVTLQGDFGKPRPALVIQSEAFNPTHETVIVLLVSSYLVDAPLFRVTIEPSEENGLKQTSQVMIDKVMTVKKERLGDVFGHLEKKSVSEVNRLIAVIMGGA